MKKAKNKKIKNSSISKSKNSLSKNLSSEKTKKQKSCFNDFFNKNKSLIIGAIIFLVLLVILLTVQLNSTGNAVINGMVYEGSDKEKKNEVLIDWGKELGTIGIGGGSGKVLPTVLGIFFGHPTEINGVPNLNVLIMVICIWVLIFITFGDILSNFSSFSKGIPWVISFVLTLIFAQFNWEVGFVISLSKILTVEASTAVFISLGAAFFAFAVLNVGVFGKNGVLAKWLLRRKMMMEINHAEIGAQGAADAVKNLGEMEKAFSNTGANLEQDAKKNK